MKREKRPTGRWRSTAQPAAVPLESLHKADILVLQHAVALLRSVWQDPGRAARHGNPAHVRLHAAPRQCTRKANDGALESIADVSARSRGAD
jgi:hypothetical protein